MNRAQSAAMNVTVAKQPTAPIVLATINARYIHSAFGLRYLKANLGGLADHAEIKEFTLESRPLDIVEALLSDHPKVIGFGVYIWNVRQSEQVVALLKQVAPQVVIVVGGPEVSYEQDQQSITELADYVISGWGEVSFRSLCQSLLSGERPQEKFINGEQAKLSEIQMPYFLYTEQDISHRVLYVEASRGCPFKCEFCLSALDKTAWPFDVPQFLNEMDCLYQRGARQFKFVDRTFNLKVKTSLQILDFFLDRMDENLFLHFELIPDHLPDALKEKIAQFPPGVLQFEVGIQTFNQEVQSLISRRQDNELAKANLEWISTNTHAHVHADLIFGLPGETLAGFAESFDQLLALKPHEIQLGILKRLKGSPIIRHTEEYQLVFNPEPPFNIVANRDVSFSDLQRINRFARFWDLIANSGRFKSTLPVILGQQPFWNFLALSDQLFRLSGQTYKISLLRLYDLVYQAYGSIFGNAERLLGSIQRDFSRSGLKSLPKCLIESGSTINRSAFNSIANNEGHRAKSRQNRHR